MYILSYLPVEDQPSLRELNCMRYTDSSGAENKIYIIEALSAQWRRLGLALNVSVSTLDNIEANRKKVEDCCQELLSRWLHGTIGSQVPVTWESILVAMEDVRLGTLACQLRSILHDEGTLYIQSNKYMYRPKVMQVCFCMPNNVALCSALHGKV